jgi:hypothetical protein
MRTGFIWLSILCSERILGKITTTLPLFYDTRNRMQYKGIKFIKYDAFHESLWFRSRIRSQFSKQKPDTVITAAVWTN